MLGGRSGGLDDVPEELRERVQFALMELLKNLGCDLKVVAVAGGGNPGRVDLLLVIKESSSWGFLDRSRDLLPGGFFEERLRRIVGKISRRVGTQVNAVVLTPELLEEIPPTYLEVLGKLTVVFDSEGLFERVLTKHRMRLELSSKLMSRFKNSAK